MAHNANHPSILRSQPNITIQKSNILSNFHVAEPLTDESKPPEPHPRSQEGQDVAEVCQRDGGLPGRRRGGESRHVGLLQLADDASGVEHLHAGYGKALLKQLLGLL
jgi:hypothetical protein